MIVIVDCMGGDKAPLEVVKGAYAASLEYNANFILVGDKAEILRIADEEGYDLRRFDIVDAPVTVEMTDPPLAVTQGSLSPTARFQETAVPISSLAQTPGPDFTCQ